MGRFLPCARAPSDTSARIGRSPSIGGARLEPLVPSLADGAGMKTTLVFSTLALAASGLLAACFYEVGDLADPGAGGSGGASSASSSGSGGGKVGSASGSGGENSASSSASSASASSASTGGGGGGGEGGAPGLPFLSCRQDAAYYGVCGGDGGQVLVWITEVPLEVQNACGDPQASNPRCLVRHCTEEAGAVRGDGPECGRTGITHGSPASARRRTRPSSTMLDAAATVHRQCRPQADRGAKNCCSATASRWQEPARSSAATCSALRDDCACPVSGRQEQRWIARSMRWNGRVRE